MAVAAVHASAPVPSPHSQATNAMQVNHSKLNGQYGGHSLCNEN